MGGKGGFYSALGHYFFFLKPMADLGFPESPSEEEPPPPPSLTGVLSVASSSGVVFFCSDMMSSLRCVAAHLRSIG